MISSRARMFVSAAATIAIAVPFLSVPAEAQTYRIVNTRTGASVVVDCATPPKKSVAWIKQNCRRVQAGAKGGNVEFEWKVEEGEP